MDVVEVAATILRNRAKFLRTPAGRMAAQWHEADADMVASELDRQASLLASAVRAQLSAGEG